MRNPFARWWERRAIVLEPPDGTWFPGGMTDSGAIVTPLSALSVPAVFACVQVLSQDLARTPIKLRQKVAEDTFEDAVDHPLYEILHDLANPEQTSYQVKAALQWQLLLHGRAFAEIVRVDGRVTAIWPLETCSMRVDRTPARVKRWTYTAGAETHTWLFDPSAPPIFELVSETPILRCRELIGSALGLQQYVATFFRNNARPVGILTAPGAVNEETAVRLRDTWATGYGGSANRGKVPVLTNGLKFDAIASTNEDAQVTETMKAIATAICGCFRVPPWRAGLMESTNYSNMESGENAYVTSTLDPIFAAWEAALQRDLLTVRQFGQYTIQFDRSALLRSDMKALHDSLAVGRNTGFYSANDCRRKLGENPIPNGDDYLVNSALQPVGAPNVA